MTFVLGFSADLLSTLRRILFEHFLLFFASLLSVWLRSFSVVHLRLSVKRDVSLRATAVQLNSALLAPCIIRLDNARPCIIGGIMHGSLARL